MKVDDPRVPLGAHILPTSGEATRTGQGGRVRPEGDAVTLSRDLRLAKDAVAAAAVSPEIRPDATARAREALANGSLDANVERLADALIDSLLESHDPAP